MSLKELKRIDQLAKIEDDLIEKNTLCTISVKGHNFPIQSFVIGSKDKSLPTFGLFAGVHGLEKIGTQVALTYLESLFSQLRWDSSLREHFQNIRLISIPLINPGGMYLKWRSNPNGVDLMRNSPIEASEPPPLLVGGHRISSKIPWYRGPIDSPMEKESQCLIDFLKQEAFRASCLLTLDLHSGFGLRDRLWYPYAKTIDSFPRKAEAEAIRDLKERAYPHHIYTVEAQSKSYTTHGDLWDYLFDIHQQENPHTAFVPWTLEMGSWMWIKKNPAQIFSLFGLFNPVKVHRYERIMRRHFILLDFLLRAVKHPEAWSIAK